MGEVWFYCNHALVRQIHGLHKSKLHALCTVPFHRLRRQSMDCNATQGSILCAAQSMDCTKPCFESTIHYVYMMHLAQINCFDQFPRLFSQRKYKNSWHEILFFVLWESSDSTMSPGLGTKFIVVGNLVVTFILSTC